MGAGGSELAFCLQSPRVHATHERPHGSHLVPFATRKLVFLHDVIRPRANLAANSRGSGGDAGFPWGELCDRRGLST